MMKYIRTKDGKINWIFFPNNEQKEIEFANKLNAKFADTIEELCDYEMHYDNNGEFVIRPIKHVDWQSLKRVVINKWFKDCKLAIKTDKGLIYVAKMNEKGELELI